ncbi:MAG TPA: ankyrin repeat domain-containing protein [Candidatus Ozemobacteraceae bacterium]|nr:ankyrin repeat domain-containing protein [Candidatus Ozemobacteraceae bacterium]
MARQGDHPSSLLLVIGGAYILAQLYLGTVRESSSQKAVSGPAVPPAYEVITPDSNPFGHDSNGRSPLHLAAERGQTDLVEIYLRSGVSVDQTDRAGNTPLMYAAGAGREKSVQFLLSKGAIVDARNKGGRTPFLAALFGGHGKAADILSDAGADVKAVDGAGWTALHCAAENGLDEWVKRLLILRLDPNALRIQEWTPLHVATYKRHPKCVQYLLEAGADPGLRMGYGHTAYDIANGRRSEELQRVFRKFREQPIRKPAWLYPPAEKGGLPPEAPPEPGHTSH